MKATLVLASRLRIPDNSDAVDCGDAVRAHNAKERYADRSTDSLRIAHA